MQTLYPYQVRFVISALTRYAEFHEDEESPHWHALASAAACLERILQGETPADAAEVAKRLKALEATNTGYYFIVASAEAIIDGHRLGLIIVHPEIPRPPTRPFFIGIDTGSGDRACYWRGKSHA